MTEAKYIWMDGELVNWHDAKVTRSISYTSLW